MNNKEKDIELAFAFTRTIIENPELLNKIPNGSTIHFVDDKAITNKKKQKKQSKDIYVKVEPKFSFVS